MKWKGKLMSFSLATDELLEEKQITAFSKKQYWFFAYAYQELQFSKGVRVVISNPSLSKEQGRLF